MTDINTTLETSGGYPKVNNPPLSQLPELLFFTYANAKYHVFATLYPIFALMSNPDAIVEIILSEYELFKKNYANIMEFYDTNYPGKVRYTSVDTHPLIKKVIPNAARFVIEPTLKAKYVYIGDIDILLLEDVLDYWLQFMEKHQCDFGNCLRNEKRLTGLHFIPYDKMYPLIIPPDVDLRTNDEMLLCQLMREKKLRFPVNANISERKLHGAHISYFSRAPLPSMTTLDKEAVYFHWGWLESAKEYLNVRYTEPVIRFTEWLNKEQVDLRRIIQIIDMWAFFLKEHPGKSLFEREQPPKVLPKSKKHLDFLSNGDYHTACSRQDILSRFED